MALTTNQLAVGMFGIAAGGYKSTIDSLIAANGVSATAALLLPYTNLNPQFLGKDLYSNATFAAGLTAQLLVGASSTLQSSVATIISDYMANNSTLSRGAVTANIIDALLTISSTDSTLGIYKTNFVSKVALADAYTGTSTDFTVLAGVIGTTSTTASYTLTADKDTVIEGTAITYTVTRTGDLTTTPSLTYNAAGDTNGGTVTAATASTDFTPASGTVTFAAGSATATIKISATSDSSLEGLEGIKLSLFNGTTVVGTKSTLISDDPNAPTPGQSFTLTTSADSGTSFTGGSGNDTFVSVIGTNGLSANGTTLNAGDNLAGGSGTDTLSLSIGGTNSSGVSTASFNLSSIEQISLANFQTADNDAVETNVNTSGNTVDLAQATGVAGITVTASSATGDTAFTNVQAIVTAAMGNGSGDLSIAYASTAVSGTADAQTLTLSGQTAGNFSVNGIETLNIASGTATNKIAVNDGSTATIKTINVTGDKQLTLTEGATAADNAVTVINAATLTGKLLVTTGSLAADMSITGGTANDTITFSGATFSSADTVDGGSGTDILSVANTAAMSATTFGAVTNVETLTLTGAGAALTLAANISATGINTADAGNQVVTLNTGYTNATTVTLESGDKVVNSSANVALTLAMSGVDLVTATSITGGTGTDILNLTADSTATSTTQFANITAIDSIVIVDAGDASSGTSAKGKDVNLDLGAYATALTIDGSALDAGDTGASSDATNENLVVNGATATKNLIITGGGGLDSITGGTGNDSINAGAGNDLITMGANLTSTDTIDGGSGTDTLSVSSLSSTGLTNVTNVETLSLSGSGSTATLASNLAFTSIDMDTVDNAAQTLTISTGYTNALTVLVDNGDKVVNSANVALTVTSNGAGLVSTTITGGTGTDVLNITADSGAASFASQITNVETITIVDGGDSASTAGKDITLTLGAYGTALTIDGSALDAADTTATDITAEILTVSGATATKALTITAGAGGSAISSGIGNDVVTGGSGVDAITDAGGNDNYSLGAGNDTINMATFLDNNDTINGGDGTDVLTVGATTTDTSYINVSNIETLTSGAITLTHTLSTFANAAGIRTINTIAGGGTSINATGMTGNLTINSLGILTGNNDTLVGGSGNDNFKFTGTAGFEAGDTVTGGSGTDTLTLTLGTTAGSTAAITTSNVATIEKIVVTTATAAVNLGQLIISNGTFVSVTGATIDASGVTGGGTTYIDAAAETESTLVILGGTGRNTLTGGSGNDSIVGGANPDSITGGLGADTMTGGAGVDTFFYSGVGFETGTVSPAVVYYGGTVVAGSSVSTVSMDKITDFGNGGDTIITNTSGTAYTTDTTTNGSGKIWTALSGYLKGAYDSTAQTFVFSATGSETLFVYDLDGSTGTNDLRGIVLVGYVDTGTADGVSGVSSGVSAA